MVFVWLFGGILIVTAAYFIPGHGSDLWPNIDMAGVALAAYLIILTTYSMRKPFSPRVIIGVWLVVVLSIFTVYRSWTTTYEMSHWQRNKLQSNAHEAGHGLLTYETRMTLLRVLNAYYNQAPGKHENVRQIFNKIFPENDNGRNISNDIYRFIYSAEPYRDENVKVVLRSISDTTIVLQAKDWAGIGLNPLFVNFDGTKGHRQCSASLSLKGVQYDLEN